jgi:WW domain-containing oxidoreductase
VRWGALSEEIAMSLLTMIKPNGPSGFGYGSTAEGVTAGLSLDGRTYLLTGCNSGLGFETLRVLTLRGAHVVAAARTLEKAWAACASVKGPTTPVACELAEPASVRGAVATVKALNIPIDGIICNAGIMALPKLNQAYGYELQFFTNHVGHFMLVTGLIETLAADARVTILSSSAHKFAPKGGIEFDNLSGEKGYSAWRAYGQSKMARAESDHPVSCS